MDTHGYYNNWVGYTRIKLPQGWLHYRIESKLDRIHWDRITTGLDTLGYNYNWVGYTRIQLQLGWIHEDTITDGFDKLG